MAANKIKGRKTTTNNTERIKTAGNYKEGRKATAKSEMGEVPTANKNERRKTATS
jgi:hypothetical protein